MVPTRKHVKNIEKELFLIDMNIEKEKIKKRSLLVEYQKFKEIHCVICGVLLYHSGIGRFPKYCNKHRKEKRNRTHASWREKNPTYMRFYMRDYRERKKKLPKIYDGET